MTCMKERVLAAAGLGRWRDTLNATHILTWQVHAVGEL